MSTKDERINNFRVVGAGLGRTGTSSLREALNIIGFGPCYHMSEVVKHWESWIWKSVGDLKGQGNPIEWDEVFGYKKFEPWRSCVDFPACLYYAELMHYYPNSKVILTWREPEKWYESFYNTIAMISYWHPQRSWVFVLLHIFTWPSPIRYHFKWHSYEGGNREKRFFGEEALATKENTIRVYNVWTEEVKRTVPENKLVIFQPQMGWEPLCKFLDVPIPNQPFPQANDRGTMSKMLYIYLAVAITECILFPVHLIKWVRFWWKGGYRDVAKKVVEAKKISIFLEQEITSGVDRKIKRH